MDQLHELTIEYPEDMPEIREMRRILIGKYQVKLVESGHGKGGLFPALDGVVILLSWALIKIGTSFLEELGKDIYEKFKELLVKIRSRTYESDNQTIDICFAVPCDELGVTLVFRLPPYPLDSSDVSESELLEIVHIWPAIDVFERDALYYANEVLSDFVKELSNKIGMIEFSYNIDENRWKISKMV